MTMQPRTCYVVGAMSLSLALRPTPAPGDYVIAADRGYDSLMAYGVNPDLVVGDFDSLGSVPKHPNVIQLPAEKDDTDTQLAVRLALGPRASWPERRPPPPPSGTAPLPSPPG